jgi:outer membrane lipoprotein-sorting protein
MKNLFLFFACVILGAIGVNGQNDPKAVEIMSSSRQKYNSLKDMTTSFKYTLENKSLKNGNTSRTGTMKIKGKKYRVSFSEQEVICDGATIWMVMKPEKEINITEFDPEESLSLDRMYKIYEKETKSRYDKEETIGASVYHKMSLFSLNKNSDYTRVEVWVNKKSLMLERALIFQRNGALVRYELSNIKTDTGILDSEFVFNKASYPGFEIVDLR